MGEGGLGRKSLITASRLQLVPIQSATPEINIRDKTTVVGQ
jgi:hypothetical protein